MIDARSDTHLWSATYDRGLDDLFAIQDEIAAEVVRQLKITLLGEAPRVPQTDPQAYALILQARDLLNQYEPEYLPAAEALLRQALEKEPGNGRIVLELAGVQAHRYNFARDRTSQDQAERRVRELVAQAEALDPDSEFLPAWHAGLAAFEGDLAAAARHSARILERNPTDPNDLNQALVIAQVPGRYDEAIALAEYLLDRDPLCFPCRYRLSVLYREVGRLEDSDAAVRAFLEVAPDWNMNYSRAKTHLVNGEAQAALDLLAEDESGPQVLSARAMALHDLGRQAQFEATFAELRGKWAQDHPVEIAQVYAWTGEADAAFKLLDSSLPRHTTFAILALRDPTFARLHADPRWHALQQRYGITPEQLAAIEFKITLPK